MRTKQNYFGPLLLSFLVVLILTSCGSKDSDKYLEKRAGPWKVTKVEQDWYSANSTSPDSVKTYESDTLGYFNFYHSDPKYVYIVINYPSLYLIPDWDAYYELHPNNREILIISNWHGANLYDYVFTVTDPNKNKQKWSITSSDGGTGLVA